MIQNPIERPRYPDKAGQGAFVLGGTSVAPGSRATIDIPLSRLHDHTQMSLTVQVVRGSRPGPVLFLTAAVHGDEINGVEIIRRLLKLSALKRLRGTVVAVPVVNVYGFISQTRYLPDRRDLNRSFPGSPGGSLAGQLANTFLSEVITHCTHGIDLHTGAIHRENLPQVRGDLSNGTVREMATAFGVPVILNAALREGSLRKAGIDAGIPVLVYEGGTALRFDESAIRAGVKGVARVMQSLGMIRQRPSKSPSSSAIARKSTWIRSPAGGILRQQAALGTSVEVGQLIGIVGDPYGEREVAIHAPEPGIIIGASNLPVVNQGDGLFNLALVTDPDATADAVDIFQDDWEQNQHVFDGVDTT